MKGRSLALALALAVLLPGAARAAATLTPAQMAARVGADLDRSLVDNEGIVVAAERRGRVLFVVARGLRDRVSGARVDPRTVFDAAAVSTQFTGMLAAQLIAQGKLQLDAPVARYLPAFQAHPDVRISDLLHQSSGLAEYDDLSRFGDAYRSFARDGSMTPVLAQLAATPLDFTPGTRFAYSSTNSRVLQLAIERVTGEPLQTLFARRIARPLGLRATRFGASHRVSDVALGYTGGPESSPVPAQSLAWAGGAGGLTTTGRDLLRWDAALLAPGVFNARVLRLFFTPSNVQPKGMGRYAFGMVIDGLGGHPMDWHNGETAGFRAMNAIFPRDGVAVAVLSNAGSAPVARIAFRTFGTIVGLPPAAVRLPDAAVRADRAALVWALGVFLGAMLLGVLALLTMRESIGWGVAATCAGAFGGGIAALLAFGPVWWVFAVAVAPALFYVAFTVGARDRAASSLRLPIA